MTTTTWSSLGTPLAVNVAGTAADAADGSACAAGAPAAAGRPGWARPRAGPAATAVRRARRPGRTGGLRGGVGVMLISLRRGEGPPDNRGEQRLGDLRQAGGRCGAVWGCVAGRARAATGKESGMGPRTAGAPLSARVRTGERVGFGT